MLNSILKGIDITDLQSRLERLEALNKKTELTVAERGERVRQIVIEEMGQDTEAQEKAVSVLLRYAREEN